MDTDWSIAAGPDDPVLIVPWADDNANLRFIDLSKDPTQIGLVQEAVKWPELRAALLRLNAAKSQTWTAKCDAWVLSADERELDFGPVPHGFGAYIDVFIRSPEHFSSLQKQKAMAEKLAADARGLPPTDARADFVLRPALWQEIAGYALTVYAFGFGENKLQARAQWAEALANVTRLVIAHAG